MKQKIIDVLILICIIVTIPLWVIFLIIIFASIPKDFYKNYDEYRNAEEEMLGL